MNIYCRPKLGRTELLTVLLQLLLPAFLSAQPHPSIYNQWNFGFTNSLQHTRDMALPSWGPYSSNFNGISHVPAANNGLRFDVVVQPSLYLRTKTVLASTQRESGYHPWYATPDLSYFSYRYELEWKDKVYCDVSFSRVDDNVRLITAEFVNNAPLNRSLALNMFSTIAYPYKKRVLAQLPKGVAWQRASDYLEIQDSIKQANYNLVYNGQLRGQVNDDEAVSHTAIVIGKTPGQKVSYRLVNDHNIPKAIIMFRYKQPGGNSAKFEAEVNGKHIENVEFKTAQDYQLVRVEIGDLSAGDVVFSLKSLANNSIALDGFVLLNKDNDTPINFSSDKLKLSPVEVPVNIPNACIIKYDDIKEYYGLVWDDLKADRRIIQSDDPDEALSQFDNLVKSGGARLNNGTIAGNQKGWFNNIFSAPIIVKPNQKVTRYAYLVSGTDAAEVAQRLHTLNSQWKDASIIYNKQQVKTSFKTYNKAGEKFALSQQLMAATTLTNVNYPAFAGNKFIKHTTPGKRWSSFYTWDSGFIGLGYSTLNIGRAVETLNAYTSDITDQSAFLEHGTPLPVQAYLFNELWDRTQNLEYLKYFYPRLKRYYEFLGGAENSPTRKLKSNLLQTWDIFYNSGGWDDYAPQVFVRHQHLEKEFAPVVNTAHQIRFAKLLEMAASQLGYTDDISKYSEDIKGYENALQQYSWDETSGYFGYVKHNAEGKATGILRTAAGENYNMGLDGCSPLIAGICTPHQKNRIVEHLFTKGQLWTDQGITAIDQQAPYYNKDGYWNGRVWMAHQWFIWKTMLDINEPDKAIQIAQTALSVWQRETQDTYNCWENFSVETGNGGGWHQFGALSSPVLNWFSALYQPGTATYGFDVWPVKQKFNQDNTKFSGDFKIFPGKNQQAAAMLFCLNDHHNYVAKCNGKPLNIKKVLGGLYIVRIPIHDNSDYAFHLELNKAKGSN